MMLVRRVSDLDQAPELHLARLLVLLYAFEEGGQDGCIGGLTKLAKLDFLLRYPVMLERALQAKGRSTREVKLCDHERWSVESEMVRYRFGPWDHRYREFLNILVSKNLVYVNVEGRTVFISLTEEGFVVTRGLVMSPFFEQYLRRARLLKRHFDLTATTLMRFIYETFPEIISLRPNEVIKS